MEQDLWNTKSLSLLLNNEVFLGVFNFIAWSLDLLCDKASDLVSDFEEEMFLLVLDLRAEGLVDFSLGNTNDILEFFWSTTALRLASAS